MTLDLKGKLFTFPVDFLDEGVDTVLGRVRDEAGLDGVAFAAVYHDARDVFPHNPRRAVYYHDAGSVAFHPEARRYEDLAIKPIVSEVARDEDVLRSVVDAARPRGLRVDGWLNLLHCDRGREVIDHTTRNAFGDPSLTELCPANPDATAYVAALSADVASRGVDRIIAEGLHYYGFDHGYHHERSFVNVDQRAKFLLGLCFCRFCRDLADADGVDSEALANWVQSEVRMALSRPSPRSVDDHVTREEVATGFDGALGRFLEMRTRCVSQLVHRCHDAVREASDEVRLVVMDPGGAIKGYLSGRPEGVYAADTGWTIGLDLAEVAGFCDEIETMSYAADPARIRAEFERYREVAGPLAKIATVLRPAVPDCVSAADLATKVLVLRDCGVTQIDYYHYGLMQLDALQWIRQAEQELAGR